MPDPTPEERADAVSRWGQEHPTPGPPDRSVLEAIRDARRQGVTGRLRVTTDALEDLRADYEHDETNARYFYPEPRR